MTRAEFQAASLARGLTPSRDKLKRLIRDVRFHTRRDLGREVDEALGEAMELIAKADESLGRAVWHAKLKAEQEQSA